MKAKLFTLLTLLLIGISGAWAENEIVWWKVGSTGPAVGTAFNVQNGSSENVLQVAFGSMDSSKDDKNATNYTTGDASVTINYNSTDYSFDKYASTSKTNGNSNSNLNADGTSTGNYMAFVPQYDGTIIVGIQNAGTSKTVYCFEDGTKKGGVLIGTGSGTTNWDGASVLNSSSAYTGGIKITVSANKTYTISVSASKGQWLGVIYEYDPDGGGSDLTPSNLTLTSATSLLLAKDATSTITHTTSSTGAITYSTGNVSVATVSDAGVITAQGGGSTTITVSQAADETYEAGSADVEVYVPYDAASGTEFTIGDNTHAFDYPSSTYYFTNGFNITNSGNKAYGSASLSGASKYSASVTYTINIPEGITIKSAIVTGRNNYANEGGIPAANWGTLFGTDYSSEALPWSADAAITKYIDFGDEGRTGTLTFTPGGNQVQFIIVLKTTRPVAVTGVSLNKTSTSIEVGGTETLTATIAPAEATNKNVTWTSDNTSVATVSAAGVVTAVAAGSATITATTEDGSFTATCDVTVIASTKIKTLPFSEDFTTWTSATFSQGNTTTADVIKGITFYCSHATRTFSANANGLTFPDNNIASGNYYFAIQMTNVANSSIKVTIVPQTASDKKSSVKYVFKEENTLGTPGSTGSQAQALTNGGDIVITKECTGNDVTLYLGRYNGNAENTTIKSITIEKTVQKITPAYDKITYVTTDNLDFTGVDGLTAYVATSANATGVTMTEVEDAVPAGTPLLLIGTASTAYSVPVAASATTPATNYLEAGGVTIGGDDKYDYILKSDGDFHRVTSASLLAAGKAYLHLTEAPAARLSIIFDEGETTGVVSVGKPQTAGNREVYNLNGQRVNASHKGIVIVNGKKYLNK